MTDEEYNNRVIALMSELIKTENANGSQTTELFLLYNYRFKPRETKKECGGCRARVFKRMKEYYSQMKQYVGIDQCPEFLKKKLKDKVVIGAGPDTEMFINGDENGVWHVCKLTYSEVLEYQNKINERN